MTDDLVVARYPKQPIVPGSVFESLTVIREVDRVGPNRRALCICVCGNEKIAYVGNLRAGRTKSCGCLHVDRSAVGRAAIIATRHEQAQVTDKGRICLTCNTWKPWPQFAKDNRPNRTRASNCKTCSKQRSLLSTFRINQADYTWLESKQGGRCALCKEPESKPGTRLAVDHDHAAPCGCGPRRGCKSCIRGLLCSVCNRLLGLVERRPLLRVKFADYLQHRPFSRR
jgi:hypothetical protein